jgi:hypothetical protein
MQATRVRHSSGGCCISEERPVSASHELEDCELVVLAPCPPPRVDAKGKVWGGQMARAKMDPGGEGVAKRSRDLGRHQRPSGAPEEDRSRRGPMFRRTSTVAR